MTPHFTDKELACQCGCGMLPARDFMEKIETLRTICDFPLLVNSAARCPEHNATVSATGRSGPHTTGRAIDIGISGPQAFRLLDAAVRSGLFTGIGIAQNGGRRFIHLDDLPGSATSPRPRVWSY